MDVCHLVAGCGIFLSDTTGVTTGRLVFGLIYSLTTFLWSDWSQIMLKCYVRPFKQLCYQPRMHELYRLTESASMTGKTLDQRHDKNVQIFPVCTVQTVEQKYAEADTVPPNTSHNYCPFEWCVDFFRPMVQNLSHVLLFLTFFSSSFSLAPSRVKMIPVWELRPTADTTILPDPSITWVPEERFKKLPVTTSTTVFFFTLIYWW